MTEPTSRTLLRGHERLLVRGGVLLTGAILLSALGGWSRRAHDEPVVPASAGASTADASASRSFDDRAALLKLRLDRAEAVMAYSARYQIPADLSAAIYDNALAEGIDPELGFRLVKVESQFKATARSQRSAIGYTQMMLATARYYKRNITEAELYDRDTNLRLGFRFLKSLLKQYHYDYHLALLAYNRGPGRVDSIIADGGDPANGYSDAVLGGFTPRRISAVQQERHAEVLGSGM